MHSVVCVFFAVLTLAGCASGPSTKKLQTKVSSERPEWIDNPRAVYSDTQYVSAVGYGADRETAEKSALGSLVAIFGQKVSGKTIVNSRYTEAVRAGKVLVEEDSAIQRAVTSSWDQKSIIGAEIKDTWFDGVKTFYAVAVMDKAKAMVLYSGLIESNESTVKKMTAIPISERNTLDAYTRFDLAATIADTNNEFLNVLSVVSPGAAAARRGTISTGDDLRLECRKIAENIPIFISIENDRNEQIKASFASVLSAAGFKIAKQESRYALRARLTLSETQLPKNPNKFARYLVEANLVDGSTNTTVMPYTVNGREGHATLDEAEHRAVRSADKKIRQEFGNAFSEFLGKQN